MVRWVVISFDSKNEERTRIVFSEGVVVGGREYVGIHIWFPLYDYVTSMYRTPRLSVQTHRIHIHLSPESWIIGYDDEDGMLPNDDPGVLEYWTTQTVFSPGVKYYRHDRCSSELGAITHDRDVPEGSSFCPWQKDPHIKR